MAALWMVIRHNWQYEDKMCDILVEMMGIATSVEQAKGQVDSEIDDLIDGYSDVGLQKPSDWEELDGRWTRQFSQDSIDYEIIPAEVGFPDHYTRIVG